MIFYCKFCNNPCNNVYYDYFTCRNHDCLVFFSSREHSIWFCKNGLEIELDAISSCTSLVKYEPPNYNKYNSIYTGIFSGYILEDYCYHGEFRVLNPLVSVPKILPVTPDKFHHYLNKLTKLIPFS